MTEFYTSDLHFFHRKIVEFTNRPWAAEDNNAALIDIWNTQIGPRDTVYHLGDFAFRNKNQHGDVLNILNQLNGNIRMIKGNHCPTKLYDVVVREAKNVEWFRDYFEHKIDGHLVCMIHYPMEVWRNSQYGSFHLHGHTHGNLESVGRRLDVGIDNAFHVLGEHRLFTNEDILNYLLPRDTHNPENRQQR